MALKARQHSQSQEAWSVQSFGRGVHSVGLASLSSLIFGAPSVRRRRDPAPGSQIQPPPTKKYRMASNKIHIFWDGKLSLATMGYDYNPYLSLKMCIIDEYWCAKPHDFMAWPYHSASATGSSLSFSLWKIQEVYKLASGLRLRRNKYYGGYELLC